MSFKPIRYDSGKIEELTLVTGVTVAKHEALEEDGNGLYQAADATTTKVNYTCLEAVINAPAGTVVLVLKTRGVEYIADTDANPAQTDVGTQADLIDQNVVNPDASVVNVFFIKRIFGDATNNQVIGEFVQDVE